MDFLSFLDKHISEIIISILFSLFMYLEYKLKSKFSNDSIFDKEVTGFKK